MPRAGRPDEAREANAARHGACLRLAAAEWKRLAETAEAWSRSQPERGEPWQCLGLAREGLVDRRGASEAYRKALDRAPDSVSIALALARNLWPCSRPAGPGVLHGQRGEHAKALEYLDKAIAVQPGNANSWNNKGYALLKQGRFVPAQRTFETATRLQPDFVPPWINLGELKIRQGQMGQAIQVLQQAIKLAPHALDARLFLAAAYLRALQPAAAPEHLEAAREISPHHPRVWQYLAMMHMDLGNKSAAGQALDRLDQLDAGLAGTLRARLDARARKDRR